MQSFKQANLLELCVYSIFSLIPCYCSLLNDFITEPIEANRKTLMILALEIKKCLPVGDMFTFIKRRQSYPTKQSFNDRNEQYKKHYSGHCIKALMYWDAALMIAACFKGAQICFQCQDQPEKIHRSVFLRWVGA